MTLAPKVSIVVAAYDVAAYLPRCIESLLGQTEKSFEVLLVNDGSTDETPSLVDGYASDDPRVRAIHRPNGGLSAARNTGLRAAKGELLCFIDGDDWVEPTMVESLISWCGSSMSTVLVAGAFVDFHDLGDRLLRSERRALPHHEIRRDVPLATEICDDNFVNLLGYAWNKTYRRDWVLASGFHFEEGLSLIEDIVFNSKVLAAAESVVLIPETYVHYVQRPRLTLGTTHDEYFLAKRSRAIDSVDFLLEEWGADSINRAERKARASGLALWMALRSAVGSDRPKDLLQKMVEQPEAEKLIARARAGSSADWRGLWASYTLMRRWYRVALLPVYSARAMKSLTRLLIRLSRRHSSARSDH